MNTPFYDLLDKCRLPVGPASTFVTAKWYAHQFDVCLSQVLTGARTTKIAFEKGSSATVAKGVEFSVEVRARGRSANAPCGT